MMLSCYIAWRFGSLGMTGVARLCLMHLSDMEESSNDLREIVE
jgi:hypothetical protein